MDSVNVARKTGGVSTAAPVSSGTTSPALPAPQETARFGIPGAPPANFVNAAMPQGLALVSPGALALPAAPVRAKSSEDEPVRAAYFSVSEVRQAATNPKVISSFIECINPSEINTIIVDIKEGDGWLLFDTSAAATAGLSPDVANAIKRNTIRKPVDLPKLVNAFHAHKFKVVVRQVLFKDAAVVRTLPETAIVDSATREAWGKGKMWVNPWSKKAQTYNIAVTKLALASGADEIQFDYVRFPDRQTGDKSRATFPEAEGSHRDAIVGFLKNAAGEIKTAYPKAKIGADVFGYVAAGRNVNDWLGQDLKAMAEYLDVIWPMQYPSHWAYKGTKAFGTEHPETVPGKVYELTTRGLRRQLGDRGNDVDIVPWLQAFPLKRFGGVTMQAPKASDLGRYVVKQREGVEAAEGDGYALWGTLSRQREVMPSLLPRER